MSIDDMCRVLRVIVVQSILIAAAVVGLPALPLAQMPPPLIKGVPPGLIGTWQVVEVHIDLGAPWKPIYQYNDPRIRGRIFHIAADSLLQNTQDRSESCRNPRTIKERYSGAELIRRSQNRRLTVPNIPTPEDFNLPFHSDSMVDVLRVSCDGGIWCKGIGQDDGIDGVWMIVMPDGSLILNWYGYSILTLKRLAADAKPEPSFDCRKAANAAEKAICGSVPLASFDRSIADAYAYAAEYIGPYELEKRTLLNLQKKFLARRNACAADAACLEKAMEEQLEVLMEPAKFLNE